MLLHPLVCFTLYICISKICCYNEVTLKKYYTQINAHSFWANHTNALKLRISVEDTCLYHMFQNVQEIWKICCVLRLPNLGNICCNNLFVLSSKKVYKIDYISREMYKVLHNASKHFHFLSLLQYIGYYLKSTILGKLHITVQL